VAGAADHGRLTATTSSVQRQSRAAARRRAVRRRRTVAVLTVLALAGLGAALANTGATPRPKATQPPHRTQAAVFRGTKSPGTLPQTKQYPSGTSAQFKTLMSDLWAGIVHDSTAKALPAFFPEAAYAQLKAITDPAADWRNRLVHDFSLDIGAAHALLGRDAPHARLLAVDVPSSYGHWIQPGGCYNSIGYYEMPNARVVYREGGVVRSFGIASMISWRGVWYVVHFGAILRSVDVGTVDDPATGPGTSAYSGTC